MMDSSIFYGYGSVVGEGCSVLAVLAVSWCGRGMIKTSVNISRRRHETPANVLLLYRSERLRHLRYFKLNLPARVCYTKQSLPFAHTYDIHKYLYKYNRNGQSVNICQPWYLRDRKKSEAATCTITRYANVFHIYLWIIFKCEPLVELLKYQQYNNTSMQTITTYSTIRTIRAFKYSSQITPSILHQ